MNARRFFAIVGLALAAGAGVAVAEEAKPSIEERAQQYIEQVRAMKSGVDAATMDSYNEQIDEAWKFWNAHSGESYPLLRRTLNAELKKADASPVILLDLGFFLTLQNDAESLPIAKQALYALDTNAPIVRDSAQQLFFFTWYVATEPENGVFEFLDRAFLRGKVAAIIPPRRVLLNEVMTCAFLYGRLGEAGEEHLRKQLQDPTVVPRVLEVLIQVGSPASNDAVLEVLHRNPGYDNFARGMAFLLRNGGPAGREAILAWDTTNLDDRSKAFYEKVRKEAAVATYVKLLKDFGPAPNVQRYEDQGVRERLIAMAKDRESLRLLTPQDILYSGLPTDEVMALLREFRDNRFGRLNDESLVDVEMANEIMNTLRYRGR